MENQNLKELLPITAGQQELAQKLINEFQDSQLLWFSGFLAGYVSANQKVNATKPNGAIAEVQLPLLSPNNNGLSGSSHLKGQETKSITVLFGTRTGNSRKAAELLQLKASEKGIKTSLVDMSEYNTKNLKNETNLVVIVSTHGEGEPPLAAEEFYAFLHGSRVPKLENLNYSVLALGDKSYAQYCKTGADIDKKLTDLGAKRIVERHDCDVDFLPVANNWVNLVIEKSVELQGATIVPSLNGAPSSTASSQYSRSNPFPAKVLEKIKLNGRGSAKETFHLELSLEGSGLTYQPGDALGVYPVNSDKLVNDLLMLTNLNGKETVSTPYGTEDFKTALQYHFEIGILSRDTIDKHNSRINNSELSAILADNTKLAEFTFGADVLDLLKAYPYTYDAPGLVAILRNLQPRLYSISSSFEAYPGEVHLTVGALRYSQRERNKNGTCSTYLTDYANTGDSLRVYIETNEGFRLPKDSSTPIIMLGPGTGVAPFRAFTQHRVETGAKGKNWLLFGDQHFTTDFLYQTEWLDYKKKGHLTNLSVAFSRDSKKKVYVQHKLKENAKELVKWLDDGAYIYVCGDMKHMAKDVLNTFVEVIAQEKQVDMEQAKELVQNLRKQKRYQEDVY